MQRFSIIMAVGLIFSSAVLATATPDEIAKLGGDEHTCMGALRAGTPSGVARYTGKFQGSWPGMKNPYGWEAGPYADEEPLYVISQDNMSEYEELLTEGQKALLKKYPANFRMRVFPSHRDFKPRDWVCDVVLANAKDAEVIDDGQGVKGTAGAHPFPFPKTGLEAIWNVINPHRTGSELSVYDIADVYSNGNIAWGRARFKTMNTGTLPDLNPRGGYHTEHVNGFFYVHFLLPDREKGFVAVGYQPNNFSKDSTQSWQYLPGIRRVRKAPEVGFDYPVPPSGLRTTDDDYMFNGSPHRYNWTLVGRKEVLVPYHNFEFNSPHLSYDEIITPNTINPDHFRYELHRVWVVEGNLKDGVRHIYKKRRIYADEDTWLGMWADNFDGQDNLWRVATIAFFYSQEAQAFHRGASIYHDLTSGNYEATYLTNERGDDWWRLNLPMERRDFSPEAAARAGQ
ncbi:MAG: DUF1329 domain-containing protein [Oceanococcus sp.]